MIHFDLDGAGFLLRSQANPLNHRPAASRTPVPNRLFPKQSMALAANAFHTSKIIGSPGLAPIPWWVSLKGTGFSPYKNIPYLKDHRISRTRPNPLVGQFEGYGLKPVQMRSIPQRLSDHPDSPQSPGGSV